MYSILLLYSHDYPFHHIFSTAQIVMKIFFHNLLPAYNTYPYRNIMPEFFPEEKEVSPALLLSVLSGNQLHTVSALLCLSPVLQYLHLQKSRAQKVYFHHDHVPDIFRIFYFSCGYFCKNVLHYFYMNVFSIS